MDLLLLLLVVVVVIMLLYHLVLAVAVATGLEQLGNAGSAAPGSRCHRWGPPA